MPHGGQAPYLEQDYVLLDVGTEASPEEIREAYLLLLQVWHPDRFAQKPQLAAKATAKAQQLIAAFARIKDAPLRRATTAVAHPAAPTLSVPPAPRPAPDLETLQQKLRALRSSEGWVPKIVQGARTLVLDCEGCGSRRQHVLMSVPYGVSISPPIFRMFMKRPWLSSHTGYYLVCDTCADAFTVEKELADKLLPRR